MSQPPPPPADQGLDAGDVREFVRPVLSRWWLVVLIVAVATAATYYYEARKPKEYTASTQIFVRTSAIDATLFGSGAAAQDDRNTKNQAQLLRTRGIADAVAKQLGYQGDPNALLASTTVVPATGSDFVTITTTSGNPQDAARIANAFATAFIRLRAQDVRDKVAADRKVAERELAQLPAIGANRLARQELTDRIRRDQVIESLPAGAAEQVDAALPPGLPSAPRPRRVAIFGFVVSLVLAILLCYGLERLDRRLRRFDQVEAAYRRPLLAALPHSAHASPRHGNSLELPGEFREAVRGLRTSLQLTSLDRPLKTILITSAVPNEGKSTLVCSLALAYYEAGLRVSVVECDLRRPSLAELLNVRPEPGLTDVLANEVGLKSAFQDPAERRDNGAEPGADDGADEPQGANGDPVAAGESAGLRTSAAVTRRIGKTGVLRVLTSGPKAPNPPTVLAAQRMRTILQRIADDSDVVLIDSPPLLVVSDTMPLVQLVDGTVLVTRLGKTTRASARHVTDLVARIPDAHILGVVANDVSDRELGNQGYGYYSYAYRGVQYGETH